MCKRPPGWRLLHDDTRRAPMFASLVRSSSILALLGVTATPMLSQTIITGVVRVKSSGPLVGAMVQITGTHAGVQTNDAGRYRLEIPRELTPKDDSVTIVARRIGFQQLT